CREREFGPHHSGKETIGNVIPSGAKGVVVKSVAIIFILEPPRY
ncbi:unnamed protein product, partial [Ascophyllum nodosum]